MTLRIARINVVVYCDVLEEDEKVDEVVFGPDDGKRPFQFYTPAKLAEWAGELPELISSTPKAE